MKHTIALKQNHEFRRLYSKGKSAVSPYFAVYCRKTNRPVSRLGITTGQPGPPPHSGALPHQRAPASAGLRRGGGGPRPGDLRPVPGAGAQLSPAHAQAGDLSAPGGAAVKALLIWMIRFYRREISPARPPCCRCPGGGGEVRRPEGRPSGRAPHSAVQPLPPAEVHRVRPRAVGPGRIQFTMWRYRCGYYSDAICMAVDAVL